MKTAYLQFLCTSMYKMDSLDEVQFNKRANEYGYAQFCAAMRTIRFDAGRQTGKSTAIRDFIKWVSNTHSVIHISHNTDAADGEKQKFVNEYGKLSSFRNDIMFIGGGSRYYFNKMIYNHVTKNEITLNRPVIIIDEPMSFDVMRAAQEYLNNYPIHNPYNDLPIFIIVGMQ
ncbi:terminase large subunit [Morganella phage vB_Mm5]